MGKGERVGVSDRVAPVACRQAAYSGRTTPNGNGHRPSAQSANRRIGCDRCAVSSADQKGDLQRQLGRLAEYASRERLMVIRSVSEIGCGLNGHRAKIMRLLSDPAVQTIVVEHRDRLARFGSESIEAALAACGRKLVVVDETEMKDDLVQDMVDVLTWFCARLYGRRTAKNRAAKALAAAQADG